MEDKGIDVLNYESVFIDRPYGAGNFVKVDLVDGDVNIHQTQRTQETHHYGGICYRFVWRSN